MISLLLLNLSVVAALTCNGSPLFCHLPFHQFTFPSTHNSAAYKLSFDCKAFFHDRQTFSKSNRDLLMNQLCQPLLSQDDKEQEGTAGRLVRALVPKGIYSTFMQCFFENNEGHDVTKQLQDGIRAFDFDTCHAGSGVKPTRVVMYHGVKNIRGLGEPLDKVLRAISTFLKNNTGEVVSLEFGDFIGDGMKMAVEIIAQLDAFFNGNGVGLYRKTGKWSTLGEMAKANRRVVVFMGHDLYQGAVNALGAKMPQWILAKDDHYLPAWDMTYMHVKAPEQMAGALTRFVCEDPPHPSGKLKTLDFDYSYDLEGAAKALRQGKWDQKVCLHDASDIINPSLMDVVSRCMATNHLAVHRIRIDHYWESQGDGDYPLLQAVQWMNLRKVALRLNLQGKVIS
jgi:hypothetical protein